MTRIQIRRGTSSEWATSNPVLAAGEPGLDTTTGEYKFGDGALTWSALSSQYVPALGAGVLNESGIYFAPPAPVLGTQALSLATVFLSPLEVTEAATLDRIGVEVTTAAATATPRLGIYTLSGSTFTLLLDAGTISGAVMGFIETTISQAVTPGTYWLAFANQVVTCTVRNQSGRWRGTLGLPTGLAQSASNQSYGQNPTGTSPGAFPSTIALSATLVNSSARLVVRVA